MQTALYLFFVISTFSILSYALEATPENIARTGLIERKGVKLDLRVPALCKLKPGLFLQVKRTHPEDAPKEVLAEEKFSITDEEIFECGSGGTSERNRLLINRQIEKSESILRRQIEKLEIRAEEIDEAGTLADRDMATSFGVINADKSKGFYKPVRVYIDGELGQPAQVFDVPGVSYKDRERDEALRDKAMANAEAIVSAKGITNPEEKESIIRDELSKLPKAVLGKAWPKAGDKSKAVFVKNTAFIHDYYDPQLKRKVGRVFYEVDVIPSDKKTVEKYLKGENIEDGKTGWILADSTRSNELRYTPSADSKTATTTGCTDCRGPTTGTSDKSAGDGKAEDETSPQAQIEDLRSASTEKLVSVLKNDFACLANSNITNFMSQLRTEQPQSGNLVGAYKKILQKKLRAKSPSISSAEIEQLTAIDAMARTIYGEMRSCNNRNGSRYSKAVARVILNRAGECMKAKKSCEFSAGSNPAKNQNDAIIGVIGRNKQFSAWNRNDPNTKEMMCISKGDESEMRAWGDALNIAAHAIVETTAFKSETATVGTNTFHYSSGMKPYWARSMSRRLPISIGGLPVDNSRCIIAWQSKAGAQYYSILYDSDF
jgi:Cell Wall Hydrolase